MATSLPDGLEYTVVYSEQVRQQLKDLAERARQRGRGQDFLTAVKAIDANLRHNPVDFGDPHYDLPGAKLTVYARIFPPLLATYSVHQHKSVVFVRSFQPFPPDAF